MLQVEFLITLLNNSDGNTKRPASRTIFLKKFKRYVQENIKSTNVSTKASKLTISKTFYLASYI